MNKVKKLSQRVMRELGPQLTESMYGKLLFHYIRAMGYEVETEKAIPVYFNGILLGTRRSDAIVHSPAGKFLLELKHSATDVKDFSQLYYYMLHEKIPGMLIRFHKVPGFPIGLHEDCTEKMQFVGINFGTPE